MREIYYLDDLHPGMKFRSGECNLEAGDIKAFARLYDPQPFHTDEKAAENTLFAGLVASGWHTAALTMRLLVESAHFAGGIIGTQGEISWPQPTRPGDTLHVESEVVEILPSHSHPERGTAVMRTITLNQKDEIVQTLLARIIVSCRARNVAAA